MREERFTNREIELMFSQVDAKLASISDTLNSHGLIHNEILRQAKYTKEKVRKLTLCLVVVGSVAGTAVLMGGGEHILSYLLALIL